MSVISVDEPGGAAACTVKQRFWQRLAQSLDKHFADRTKRLVPEITLRRCKHDIDRLRRLMHKSALVPVDVSVSRVSRQHIAQAAPRR